MTNTPATRSRYSTPVQKTSLVVGIVFIIVAIAGFIPGLTSDMGMMHMAGSDSHALLLGVFQVSILHNIVHLLFGLAGVISARTPRGARNYLIWGGIVYFVIFLYGIIFSGNNSANFVPLNVADNWLHIVLAVGMVALGLALGRSQSATRGSARA